MRMTSEVVNKEIEALIKSGLFSSKEALTNEAIRFFLINRPDLRREIAIDLYKRKKASLSKSARIASLPLESMKEILTSRGIEVRRSDVSTKEIDKSARRLMKRIKK